MIRIRDKKGEAQIIDSEQFPFVEVLDLDSNIIACFIVDPKAASILKIDPDSPESRRYENLFGVEFSKKIEKIKNND